MQRQPAQRQPTLASSCAVAATAAEARYRISYPDTSRRNSRVIALDAGAAAIVRRLAGRHWNGGHFLIFGRQISGSAISGSAISGSAISGSSGPGLPDARLGRPDGTEVLLSGELRDADVVVMLATAPGSAGAASIVGAACAVRSIMSAGLVIPAGGAAGDVVAALRPNAMVLVILQDGDDIPEILSALRV